MSPTPTEHPELQAPDLDRVAASIDELSRWDESAQAGWTRRGFSEAYRAEREWPQRAMRSVGLQVRYDPAGNVVGRLPGRDPNLKPLMTGSHSDTVHAAGRFDGMVGVLGGLEVVRLLQQSDIQLQRDLLVVDFLG